MEVIYKYFKEMLNYNKMMYRQQAGASCDQGEGRSNAIISRQGRLMCNHCLKGRLLLYSTDLFLE